MSNVAMIQYNGQTLLSTTTGNMSITPAGTLTLKNHVIGTDVQAFSSKLADLSGLNPSSGDTIEWDGSNFVATSHNEEATTANAPLSMNGTAVELNLNASHLEESGGNLQIKAGGITATELGPDCVNSSKIADASIGSEHLQNGAVGNLALGDNAVTTAKMSSNVELDTPSAVNGFTNKSDQSYADVQHLSIADNTSNATPSNVGLITLVEGSAYHLDIKVVCKDQTNGDVCCYTSSCLVQRATSGNASIESAQNVSVIHEDNTSMDFSLTTNVNDIAGVLTGSSNSCNWSVNVVATRVN